MKTKILALFAGIAIIAAATGCVKTVSGTRSPALNPWAQDSFVHKYERSPDQVYQASKTVIINNGVLLTASDLYSSTNGARALYGKVNQRNVWINVMPVDPNITQVTVQVRTRTGLRDLNLTDELAGQIGLQLQAQSGR
jgi:hypothetical protein